MPARQRRLWFGRLRRAPRRPPHGDGRRRDLRRARGRRGSGVGAGETLSARRDELERRRAAIAQDLRGEGADALLFTREGNVAYLCGYTTATWSNFSRPVIGLLDAQANLAIVV